VETQAAAQKTCGVSARFMADLQGRYPPSPGSARSRDGSEADEPPPDPEFESRLTRLPSEVGVLLAMVGLGGIMLPGPVGSPFLLAGGLVLWPSGFGKAERWFQKRFPRMHREGVHQIERYLTDLEHRYPGSIR